MKKLPKKIGFYRRQKRKFCEKVRYRLFVAIDKCMEQDERQALLDATEEAIEKAVHFEHIDAHKEELFDAVEAVQEERDDLRDEVEELFHAYRDVLQKNNELSEAIDLIIEFYDNREFDKLDQFIRMLKGVREISQL